MVRTTSSNCPSAITDNTRSSILNTLVIDIGGTNIKILSTGASEPRKFPSGKTMNPEQMVRGVQEAAGDWKFDVVSLGYPGLVQRGRIIVEPHNLAPGWIDFNFPAAFGCPVKIMNDAAMQALGSYQDGLLLFIGLGTGLGSALVADGVVIPLELGHLSYRKSEFEDYIGKHGLERLGKTRWQRHVEFVVSRLIDALHPDDIVLGGGNARRLKTLPHGCRLGDNAYAFAGGFRM